MISWFAMVTNLTFASDRTLLVHFGILTTCFQNRNRRLTASNACSTTTMDCNHGTNPTKSTTAGCNTTSRANPSDELLSSNSSTDGNWLRCANEDSSRWLETAQELSQQFYSKTVTSVRATGEIGILSLVAWCRRVLVITSKVYCTPQIPNAPEIHFLPALRASYCRGW